MGDRRSRQRSTDRIRCSQCVCILESCTQVVDVELQVSARAREARVVQKPTELLGRELAETRGLDFSEADFSKLLESTGRILPHRYVHRIELNADRSAEGIGERAAR